MITMYDRDTITLGKLDIVIDHTTQRIDKSRIEYAIQTLVSNALGEAWLNTDNWAAACLRVAMRRHDVEHGVRPPDYEIRDPAKLLQQFREHPIGKEYGYAPDDTGAG